VVFFVAFELLLDFRKRRSAKDNDRSETPEAPTVRDQANPQLARAYEPTYATVGAAAAATGVDRVQLDQLGQQPVSQASVTSPVLEQEVSTERSEARVETAVQSYPKPVAVAPRQRQAVSAVVQPAKVTAADVRACQRAHPSWTNARVANELGISVETLYRRLKSKEARAS
jgi:DNA-binding NtrC family response regulator